MFANSLILDIILSLTRTSRVGYLRDVRRMTVAVSRARLGLYILGRREVFEACPELRPAFDILLERPDKLMLVTGEMWPTERPNSEDDGALQGEAAMENVEHLGQFVYEMTNTKVKQLQDVPGMGAILEEDETGDQPHSDDREEEEEQEALEPDIQEVREGDNK